ncbi:DUF3515 domain-containing protein [Nocardioides sp. AX2bis]|uniref:DUF3515 domain-containing protein n=1 Tax=Nocardioides sp. AX2bis TaxID=2653157 RepID=UPI0012F0CECD|nr:DUF3515 domain-containing protein [Nocardioides sp. AX2bis]VXB80502.1 conserved exported hypothetical protein [Nocardioides sp. AX2bis]
MTRSGPRARAAVALGATLGVVLAVSGCSGAVDVDVPSLDAEQQAACDQLIDALPDRLEDLGEDGLDRVDVDPADATAAAWGDPAVVVACGVDAPEGYDRFQLCQEIDGVGWFVDDADLQDEPTEVTLTAVGYRPRVSLVVPAEYWPMGGSSAAAEVAGPVLRATELVDACR